MLKVAVQRSRRVRGPLLTAAGAAGGFWVAHRALIDDSYITLSYARNIALHGTWGLLSDVPSATATSPLWVLLLAAATALTRDALWGLAVAHVAVAAATTAVLEALARRTGLPRWTAPAAVGAVLVNPLLLSVVGMESLLLVALFAAAALAGAAARPVVLGVLAGAAFLTRMDAAPAILALVLCSPAVLRRLHVVVPVAALTAGTWTTWSWFALGTAVPDTFVIKSQQRSWGPWSVVNGWRWFAELYGADAVVAFAPLALAVPALVVAAVRARELLPWLALTLAGVVHVVTLAVLVVPPYHWYYAPAVACSLLGAVAALASLCARAGGGRSRAVRPGRLPAAVALVAVAALLVPALVVDATRALPWRVAPVQTNWASSAAYDEMGRGLRTVLRGERLLTFGEIGHLAYVCDCVVDGFADPALVDDGVRRALREAGPLLGPLLELNYRHRDVSGGPVPLAGRLEVLPTTEPAPAVSWPLDLLPGGGTVHVVPAPAP
ncbi:hypothetical protein [Kineococcus indalonis]|uniref:hypothetical protein n=1 Tax=Kineococcus indalonis TaxID=2696566 RepID=UPI001412310E|nr:hypothetical protein [Kineococcus indalonis]NAZ86254.1 hypothetical protein [Kineococcus indalonis]